MAGERSFHIFYQLVAGASEKERNELKLAGTAKDYFYLSQSGCTTIENVNDAEDYADTRVCKMRY